MKGQKRGLHGVQIMPSRVGRKRFQELAIMGTASPNSSLRRFGETGAAMLNLPPTMFVKGDWLE